MFPITVPITLGDYDYIPAAFISTRHQLILQANDTFGQVVQRNPAEKNSDLHLLDLWSV